MTSYISGKSRRPHTSFAFSARLAGRIRERIDRGRISRSIWPRSIESRLSGVEPTSSAALVAQRWKPFGPTSRLRVPRNTRANRRRRANQSRPLDPLLSGRPCLQVRKRTGRTRKGGNCSHTEIGLQCRTHGQQKALDATPRSDHMLVFYYRRKLNITPKNRGTSVESRRFQQPDL